MRCGGPDGQTWECFDAPWWRLDRWFVWFFSSRNHAKGIISFTLMGKTRKVHVRSLVPTGIRKL
jgi:hypothetical protein